jgi:hypothetical protein
MSAALWILLWIFLGFLALVILVVLAAVGLAIWGYIVLRRDPSILS